MEGDLKALFPGGKKNVVEIDYILKKSIFFCCNVLLINVLKDILNVEHIYYIVLQIS